VRTRLPPAKGGGRAARDRITHFKTQSEAECCSNNRRCNGRQSIMFRYGYDGRSNFIVLGGRPAPWRELWYFNLSLRTCDHYTGRPEKPVVAFVKEPHNGIGWLRAIIDCHDGSCKCGSNRRPRVSIRRTPNRSNVCMNRRRVCPLSAAAWACCFEFPNFACNWPAHGDDVPHLCLTTARHWRISIYFEILRGNARCGRGAATAGRF
jgi:hypothetical protein